MNGYFGALMRSSGLGVGRGAPGMTQVEASVVEIDVEHGPTTMALAAARAASTPQPASAAIAVAHSAEVPAPSATPVDEHTARGVPMVQARHATSPQADLGAAPDAADDGPHSPPAPPATEATKPPLGQALVHAAMHWVAADPRPASTVAQVVPPHAPSVVAVTAQARAVAPAQPLREAEVEPEAQASATAPTHPASLAEPSAREPMQVPALAIRPTRSVPMAPPDPLAPEARHEVVEVSIGTIHVRVDAPSAQTVARPAPPAAPRATALAPRSALSRRALRRI